MKTNEQILNEMCFLDDQGKTINSQNSQWIQWISIKDKFPEEGKDVLVWDGNLSLENVPIYEIAVYRIFNNASCFISGSYFIRGVTHWMPLPQPPD